MRHMYGIPGVRASACTWRLNEKEFLITRVEVVARERGKGYGTQLLKQILEDADREGVTLCLGVSSDMSEGSLSNEELADWYGRHGFESVGQTPLRNSEMMARLATPTARV